MNNKKKIALLCKTAKKEGKNNKTKKTLTGGGDE